MMARLIDRRNHKEYTLAEGTITVGRHADNDVRLRGSAVSRFHAELRFEEGAWILEDQGSSYGTFVNGEQLAPAAVLKNGDEIRLAITPAIPAGEHQLVFQQETEEADVARQDERIERLVFARKKIDAGEIEFERHGNLLLVHLSGVFRRREIDGLNERIRRELAAQPKTVVLDLSGVTSMNSYSLARLVELGGDLREGGESLRAFGATGTVAKLLEVPGESSPIQVYDREAEALG